MANPNVPLVQEALGAYMRGDGKRLRELMDPDIEVVGGDGLINVGTYHGFDGFLDWIRRWERPSAGSTRSRTAARPGSTSTSRWSRRSRWRKGWWRLDDE